MLVIITMEQKKDWERWDSNPRLQLRVNQRLRPLGHATTRNDHFSTEYVCNYNNGAKEKIGSGWIRTHASEETGALNQRLRPLGHATTQ
ncbi:hypothetical protein AVEN_99094-1 [Araneus ventricosus]|uniref:Uncharacterized protein n=1 Tax=Araneus ventricosus TaxID=182803 RepID=A0A4Y2K3D1_ARAVE|nr:hypothetical protein AVEN_99094-1 [Araneus ventricosus]